MSHIRQLRHREHNHLERYDHGKYKHIIQYVGHTGFYSGQVISSHGSKQNDRCHRKYRDKSRPSEGCEETCFFNTVHIVGKPCKSLCGRQCERIVTDEQFSLKGVDQHEENRGQKCNYQHTQDTKNDYIGSFFLSHYCSTSLRLVSTSCPRAMTATTMKNSTALA